MHILDSSIWFYAFGAQHMFGLFIFYFWHTLLAHTSWLIYILLLACTYICLGQLCTLLFYGAQHMLGLFIFYFWRAHTHILLTHLFSWFYACVGAQHMLGLFIFYFWCAHTYCWLIYLVLRFWRTTHVWLIYILLLAYAFGAHILAYLYVTAVQAWTRSRELFSGQLVTALPLKLTGQVALPPVPTV